MAVQVIKRTVMSQDPLTPTRKLRVSAYARISTDSDQQELSLTNQQEHYTNLIKSNPEWEFAGLYTDDGISGTSMKKRDGLNQLLEAARRGEVDLILTKSISRMARNTVDLLSLVRELNSLGVGIVFSKEGLDTRDSISEIVLCVLSSLAQGESQSISENVKWGIRTRFQEGHHFINCSRFLGYDKKDGQLVINPAEASTVRRIFSLFLNGHSVDMIASTLTKEQIPTATGATTWYPTNIRYLISNEKYAGDLRLQKTVVPNFLTHRSKKNTGEADQFYVENAHEPIVPKEVWELAHIEASRRAAALLSSDGSRTGGIKYCSKRALAGRCRCSCGAVLHQKRGKYSRWFCPECGFAISEGRLQAAVLDSFRKLVLEEGNLKELLSRAERALADGCAADPHTAGGHANGEHTGPNQPWKGGKGGSEATEAAAGRVEIIKGKDDEMTEEERVALLFQRFQIMAALDWIKNQGKASLGEMGDTCYTLAQFIDITRPGPLDTWNDDTILRFIEGVEITEAGVNVRFKAGVSVEVELPEKAGSL